MRHRLSVVGWLALLLLAGTANAHAMPSLTQAAQMPDVPEAAHSLTRLAQAQAQTPPIQTAAPAPIAAPAQPADAEPIGNVATLTGSATVTRNNAATPLKLKNDIFQNDVLHTSANSTLGVTFNDATTFNSPPTPRSPSIIICMRMAASRTRPCSISLGAPWPLSRPRSPIPAI